MKQFQSMTVNGGRTIVLDNVSDGIQRGLMWLETTVADLKSKGDKKVTASVIQRAAVCVLCDKPRADHHIHKANGKVLYYCDKDHSEEFKAPESKSVEVSYSDLAGEYQRRLERFKECEEAISKGSEEDKEEITKMVDELRELVLDLAPSLSSGFSGFTRSEDGVTAAPELVAAGEERCAFMRKEGSDQIKNGQGEGAYRIVLNTDVDWWGAPNDNAALVGALVVLLQQFKPVEVWIQQGWLGSSPMDGVTLFKLDFTNGAFDPTQLAFWLGHPDKDDNFSFAINRSLYRRNENTATTAEIPCDLYLRGDFMKLMGIDQMSFNRMLHTDKLDLMAKWISETAMRTVFIDPGPDISLPDDDTSAGLQAEGN